MKIGSFIFVLLFCSCINVQEQKDNSQSDIYFTKNEVLKDLAFFKSTVHTYCAFLPLLEKRYNIRVDCELEKLKEEIDSLNSREKCAYIMHKAISVLHDKHSQMIDKLSLLSRLKYNDVGNISNTVLSDSLYADYYCSLFADSIYKKVKTGIRIKYINGKYFNVRPFTYNGKKINAGKEISAIDNVPIYEFVDKNKFSLYNLLWDPINKQWYDDYFMMALPQLGKQKFTLTVGGEIIHFDSDKTVDNLRKEHSITDIPQVMILNNNILYIRIPQMDSSKWYLQKISELYIPGITKIIFDVRSNPGGDDLVWHEILSKLLDKPLMYSRIVGINNNEQTRKINMLLSYDKDERGDINLQQIIYPDKDSFRFKGKYYVLQDKYSYSAASALTSVAWQKEEIKLVGESSAFINGYQLPPLMFTLPHSRITFNLGFAIDLSGGEENPYMDKVEITVSESIDEYLEKVLFHDCYSFEYLNYKDKYIKAVIDDKS